jgi:hypothetical protein
MAYFMSSRQAQFLEDGVRALGRKARTALTLPDAVASQFLPLHQHPGVFSGVPADQRLSQLRGLQSQVRHLLGPTEYSRYASLALRHFEQLMYDSGQWSSGQD